METVIITELVNTVGFPIAVSVALFWQNHKTTETYNKTFTEFKDVINHNTKTIENLTKAVKDIKHKEGE